MRVGETILSKTLTSVKSAGSLGGNTKVAARKILRNPNAQWKTASAGPGKVRITRLA